MSSCCTGAGVAIMLYCCGLPPPVGTHSRLCRGQSCASHGEKREFGSKRTRRHTLWRCSAEQYHAFWHRLHHIDVGMQQRVHGWLMNELGFMRRWRGSYDGEWDGHTCVACAFKSLQDTLYETTHHCDPCLRPP